MDLAIIFSWYPGVFSLGLKYPVKPVLKLKFTSRRIDKHKIRQFIMLQVIMKHETEFSYTCNTGCWKLVSEGYMFKDDASIFQYDIVNCDQLKNFRGKKSLQRKSFRNSTVFLHYFDLLSYSCSSLFVPSEAPITGDLDIRSAFRRTWVCAVETQVDQIILPRGIHYFPKLTKIKAVVRTSTKMVMSTKKIFVLRKYFYY